MHGQDIYRVIQWYSGDKDREPGGDASSNTPVGPAMKAEIPGVEDFVRFQSGWGEHFVKINSQVSRSSVSFADPQILNIFSFKLIAGNANEALKDPHSLVLTREKAMQLFGKTDVVGRRIDIKMDDHSDPFEGFTVGGVVENIPVNSTIQFEMLGNFDYVLNSHRGKRKCGELAHDHWH